jgi:hypothetical protein
MQNALHPLSQGPRFADAEQEGSHEGRSQKQQKGA